MKAIMMRLMLMVVAVAGMAASAEAGTPGDFHPPGWNGPGGFGPVVRDHRFPTVFRDHRFPPVVRDHRFVSPPIIRDHRFPPVFRDHRFPPVFHGHRGF
jgi:hypothetical protein